MRRLDPESARTLALRLAGDPLGASAAFDIEVGGATVLRTKDAKCYVVLPKDPKREVRMVGARASSDLLDIISKLGPERRLIMPTGLFAQLADLATPGALQLLALYSSNGEVAQGTVPQPRPDLDVRSVLFGDLPLWHKMPGEAFFLSTAYGTPRELLGRGMAVGAFNGGCIAALATATVGRSYGTVQVYTQPRYRRMGLAKHCVAELVDRMRGLGLRPVLSILPMPASPAVRLVEGLGLHRVGEVALIPRAMLTI
jgi:GNAT superfamily N-acetyltransferase